MTSFKDFEALLNDIQDISEHRNFFPEAQKLVANARAALNKDFATKQSVMHHARKPKTSYIGDRSH